MRVYLYSFGEQVIFLQAIWLNENMESVWLHFKNLLCWTLITTNSLMNYFFTKFFQQHAISFQWWIFKKIRLCDTHWKSCNCGIMARSIYCVKNYVKQLKYHASFNKATQILSFKRTAKLFASQLIVRQKKEWDKECTLAVDFMVSK